MRAVTAAQMRAIDAAAVARDGEIALMRAAGAAIARLIDRYARGDGPVVALAGTATTAATRTRRWRRTPARAAASSITIPAAAARARAHDARERARIAASS
jgi:hypothetical protein